jgi:hypothetical protein
MAGHLPCQADLTGVSFELALLKRHSARVELAPRNHAGGTRASELNSGEKNEIYYRKDGGLCEYGPGGGIFNPSMLGADSEIGEGNAGVCRFAIFRQAATFEYQTWPLGDYANNQADGRVANPG